MTDTPEHEATIHGKLPTLNAEACVSMLASWYFSQAKLDGFNLTPVEARQAAIRAVFGGMPLK